MDSELGKFMMNHVNLKQIRINSGYTQEELSKSIGMKQQQYSRYERNVNKIPLETFLKIINACKLKIELTKK